MNNKNALIGLACLVIGSMGDVLAESPIATDLLASDAAEGDMQPEERFSIHGQTTFIWQQKNNFHSPYFGTNSLLNRSEGGKVKSYTWSATGFFGMRLWEGGEAYYNPEVFEGTPFNGVLVGLGAFQNGELQKGAFAAPTVYNARAFFRQTFGLGGGRVRLEDAPNQVGIEVDKNRVTLTYGRVASLDFFDQNTYSHDPRTQFLNFALWSSGAYGYAADAKGYTYGMVGEWFQDDFVLRAARLATTTVPGENQLDWSLTQNYVDQVELTHFHIFHDHPGAIRGLIYRQYANMGNFNNAMAQNTSITNVRSLTRSWGYVINAEQALSDEVGLFARWSWNPGQTETLTLEMSRSLAGGVSIKGGAWSRPNDTIGVGAAVNGISSAESAYLSSGKYTVFIGDGQLNYRTERVAEAFYGAQISKLLAATLDYQRIANPAYNADRGPINFFGFRLHAEL